MKYLVEECGANVEAKTINGDTPVLIASMYGHLATVQYLLEECGANVEAKRNDKRTALVMAQEHGKSDVEKYLVSKGPTGQLSDAAVNGDTAKAIKLIEQQGADMGWHNPDDVSEGVDELL